MTDTVYIARERDLSSVTDDVLDVFDNENIAKTYAERFTGVYLDEVPVRTEPVPEVA